MPSNCENKNKENINTCTCPYNNCQLSENNINYIIQCIYLFIAYLVLIMNKNDFSPVNIFLFIIPIEIDMVFAPMNTKYLKIVKYIIIAYVTILLLIPLLSMMGFLNDELSTFVVTDSAMLFSGLELDKSLYSMLLFPTIFVPFMLFIGTPNKNNTHTLNCL